MKCQTMDSFCTNLSRHAPQRGYRVNRTMEEVLLLSSINELHLKITNIVECYLAFIYIVYMFYIKYNGHMHETTYNNLLNYM